MLMRKRRDLGKRKNYMLRKPHEQRKDIKIQVKRYCTSGTGHPLAKRRMLYLSNSGWEGH